MIKSDTVLVLGAGASEPYGFPLGQELRKRILVSLVGNEKQFLELVELGFDPHFIEKFRNDLSDGIQDTIDDFLDDRPKFREIGSCAIAQALMSLELETRLFPKKDWYPFLFNLLEFRKATPPPITAIITFNYDRSLEHYLTKTIDVSFQDNIKDNAEKKLRALPIIHVHGQLGSYPERTYGNKGTQDDLRAAAKAIKITSDKELDDSPEYTMARKLIEEAKQIVFLGFGYHLRSLQRLGLLAPKDGRTLYGTAFGQSPQELRKRVSELFQNKIIFNDNNWTINDYLPRLEMK